MKVLRHVGELRVADLSNNNGDLVPIVRAIAAQRRRRVNPIIGVIFKLTESTGFIDSHARAGIHEARRHRLIVGGYHFLHPDRDERQQAQLFVHAARECGLWKVGDFKPVLDYEIGADGHESAHRDEFYGEVARLSHHASLLYTGGYFNPRWLPPRGHQSRNWWAAGYPHYKQPLGLPAPLMHQFTDRASVGGHLMDMSRILGGRKVLDQLVCHVAG